MNEVATISTPAQQQVVTQTPLASRMFNKSNHVGSEQPGVAEHHARVTAQDAADYKETLARMKPESIAHAQKLMSRFGSADLRRVVAERGLGSNVWVMDMAGRLNIHIEALEREIAALKSR